MSERTDERTRDEDVESLLDDDLGSGAGGGGADLDGGSGSVDVGLDDDELGVDVEALTGEPDTSAPSGSAGGSAGGSSSTSSKPGLLSRLTPSMPTVPNPLEALPSVGSVLLTFVVVFVSMGLVTAIPLLGMVPLLWAVGIFGGGFLLGAASGKARYFEVFLAGLVGGSFPVVGDFFRVALLSGVGLVPLVAAGAGVGVLAGLLGHYFGRDFRHGLTRDIE